MNKISIVLGAIGGCITTLFKGWDTILIILITFMAIDYITGVVNAAVFKSSDKSCDGGLSSKAGMKGLIRKGYILVIVLVACQLDVLLGSQVIRNVVIFTFIANESISIIENAGLMGVPIPKVMREAIDLLKSKGSKTEKEVVDD
jgi:toxin secretion/phage lysis holin